MDSSSNLTLHKSFFDDLWPLILKENRCDTHSKNTSEYFVPQRRFDNLWAHTLLAKKGFKDYQKPVELCCSCLLAPEVEPIDEQANAENEEDNDETNRCLGKPEIVPLMKQIDGIRNAQERRQLLAYRFVNRQFPWYMQHPSYESITMDYALQPFELGVLRNLHGFQCRLIIIDVAPTVRLHTMERWLKFSRYAKMIAVVRDDVLARQLLVLDGAFQTQIMQENLENNWHEELLRALGTGYSYAKELKLLEHCAQPFIFVFSSKRGMCSCNTFKVLRKF